MQPPSDASTPSPPPHLTMGCSTASPPCRLRCSAFTSRTIPSIPAYAHTAGVTSVSGPCALTRLLEASVLRTYDNHAARHRLASTFNYVCCRSLVYLSNRGSATSPAISQRWACVGGDVYGALMTESVVAKGAGPPVARHREIGAAMRQVRPKLVTALPTSAHTPIALRHIRLTTGPLDKKLETLLPI